MTKRNLLISLLALLPQLLVAREAKVGSPNGQLVVTISDEGGRATYSVQLDGQQVLLPSQLGFMADMGDFTTGLSIKGEQTERISKSYDLWQAKQKHIRYEASQLRLSFENAKGQKMAVVFNVSDNNIAFRYEIPRQKDDNPKCAIITKEATAFRMPETTTTFLTPQIDPMKGWERTKPSYEEEYKADAPMNVRSQYGQGYTFPCLFKVGRGFEIPYNRQSDGLGESLWMLISETGVNSLYYHHRRSLAEAHRRDHDSLRCGGATLRTEYRIQRWTLHLVVAYLAGQQYQLRRSGEVHRPCCCYGL